MNLMTIILIGLGLAMDAFAVSITSGILIKNVKLKNVIKIALFFGIAQGIMPLIGWLAGSAFSNYINKIDHWIAFILLCFLGAKMIWEASRKKDEDENYDPLNNKVLFTLAIATSIDALVIGVSFAFLKVSIIYACSIIAIITALVCAIGVLIGKQCSSLFRNIAEYLGGTILILMGIKILFEHLNITFDKIFGLMNIFY